MEIEYGPVYITSGCHEGRIGYYDDKEPLFSDDVDGDLELLSCKRWREPEGLDDDHDPDLKVLDMAIVYFGDFFIAKGYYIIPLEYVRPVTMDDLMKRREELHDLCGRFANAKNPDLELEPEDEDCLLRELHYVDSVLVDRMLLSRYEAVAGEGMKIFISHSSKDKEFAKWLYSDLKNAGHEPWLDEWEIGVGESIPQKISEGIKEADFVVVILSVNSVNSRWVEREWQTKYWDEIENGNIKVLPILHQDCDIPELLKTKKYADFRSSYNNGLEDILHAFKKFEKAKS